MVRWKGLICMACLPFLRRRRFCARAYQHATISKGASQCSTISDATLLSMWVVVVCC